MEELFINQSQMDLDLDFEYKKLFSGTKSTANDTTLRSLLKFGLEHKEIEIKKYLIDENIADELYELGEWNVKVHKKMKAILKDWHSESDSSLIPILYILEKLVPNFQIEEDTETKVYSLQSNKKINVGFRFSLQDAFARIYFPDDNIIVNLTSDSLVNLINCLILESVRLFLLDLEWVNGEASRLVMYELTSSQKFRDVKKGIDDKLISEFF